MRSFWKVFWFLSCIEKFCSWQIDKFRLILMFIKMSLSKLLSKLIWSTQLCPLSGEIARENGCWWIQWNSTVRSLFEIATKENEKVQPTGGAGSFSILSSRLSCTKHINRKHFILQSAHYLQVSISKMGFSHSKSHTHSWIPLYHTRHMISQMKCNFLFFTGGVWYSQNA